jgi:hypothetical protein
MIYRVLLTLVNSILTTIMLMIVGCNSVDTLPTPTPPSNSPTSVAPQPTEVPQLSLQQIKVSFDAAGFEASSTIYPMSPRDYAGAPQICDGRTFTIWHADVGYWAFILHCDTSSELGQLSEYFQKRGTILIYDSNLIVIPDEYLRDYPDYVQALDLQLRQCLSVPRCANAK